MFFGSKIKKKPSPNFNARRDVDVPDMLILHYTGMKSAQEALERMCDPDSEVSAHYMVDEDGAVTQLVQEDQRAWHAGVSYWAGVGDVNSHSIGIEIVNHGHEFGYQVFPEKQIDQVIALSKGILDRWSAISVDRVLGHSDVAPERKVDPGHLFPWERLAAAGIGLWPCPQEMDYQAAEDLILNQNSVHELLIGYGYEPQADYEDVVMAFMRHFQPEKFECWDDKPEVDVATCARLLALIRTKHDLA